jgi:putative transposase
VPVSFRAQVTGPAGHMRVADARHKLALWRYDYNNVRPHSSLANKTPAEARRALELSDGAAPGALAQPETDNYQTQGLSL